MKGDLTVEEFNEYLNLNPYTGLSVSILMMEILVIDKLGISPEEKRKYTNAAIKRMVEEFNKDLKNVQAIRDQIRLHKVVSEKKFHVN